MTQSPDLRNLLVKATDEDLTDGGRYFDETYTDLTRCRHEEIGEYQNRHDGLLIEWLWNHRHQIADQGEQLEALQKERDEAREALASCRNFLRTAPLESGVCCCGSPVDSHGIGDGHSPVDELTYHANGLLEQVEAALRI